MKQRKFYITLAFLLAVLLAPTAYSNMRFKMKAEKIDIGLANLQGEKNTPEKLTAKMTEDYLVRIETMEDSIRDVTRINKDLVITLGEKEKEIMELSNHLAALGSNSGSASLTQKLDHFADSVKAIYMAELEKERDSLLQVVNLQTEAISFLEEENKFLRNQIIQLQESLAEDIKNIRKADNLTREAFDIAKGGNMFNRKPRAKRARLLLDEVALIYENFNRKYDTEIFNTEKEKVNEAARVIGGA